MSYQKVLFTNKEEFDSFIKSETGVFPCPIGRVVADCTLGEPERYPCVGVFTLEHMTDGPDELSGAFVYLNDFKI